MPDYVRKALPSVTAEVVPPGELPPYVRQKLDEIGNTNVYGNSRQDYDVYTPQFKAEVLEFYVTNGARAASKKFRVPVGTILRWGRVTGLDIEVSKQDIAASATESRQEQAKLRREELKIELLEASSEVLGMIRDITEMATTAVSDGKTAEPGSKEALQALFASNPKIAQSAREWGVTLAVLVDKFRLEMGEATERKAYINEEVRQTLTSKLDELAKRRTLKAAVEDEPAEEITPSTKNAAAAPE